MRDILKFIRNFVLFGGFPVKAGVIFLGRGTMHVDRGDARGRTVIRRAGVTSPIVVTAWRTSIALLRPTLAIDVGANYGEVGMSGSYPSGTPVFLIEPNPALSQMLFKSAQSRRLRGDDFRVVEAAAADVKGNGHLRIEGQSSGISFLVYDESAPAAGSLQPIRTVRLDDIVASERRERIVFKIDVEGHEVDALRGFAQTLAYARKLVGIVEMRPNNLKERGTSPDALWALAQSIGTVFVFDIDDRLVECPEPDFQAFCQRPDIDRLRTDGGAELVIVKGVDAVSRLQLPTAIRMLNRLVTRRHRPLHP